MERSCLARDSSYPASHNVRGREGQRRRPAGLRALSLLRMLLIVGLVLGPGRTTAMAASDETPRPPCAGASPLPASASPGATPAIRVWTPAGMQALPGPLLPARVGPRRVPAWLVALAARFSYGGSADALLARFAAISTLKG